jgi:hypothetical protein
VVGIPVALTARSRFFEEAEATILTLKRERGLIGEPDHPRFLIIPSKLPVQLTMSKEFVHIVCL